jgi:hypothetical protein
MYVKTFFPTHKTPHIISTRVFLHFLVQVLVNENIARRRKKKLEQGREENKMKECA